MKKLCLILCIGFVSAIISNQIALAKPKIMPKKLLNKAKRYVPDEIIVKFKSKVAEKTIKKLNARIGTQAFRRNKRRDFRRLKIKSKKMLAKLIEEYRKDPNVLYAEPNYLAQAFFTPNDTYYNPLQWNLDNPVYGGINMESAWDIQTGNTDVVIAVVDTGVAYEDYIDVDGTQYYLAPDLADTNFVQGYDCVNEDDHPNDDHLHGTFVTGVIAQDTNNAMGCAGVAFNCSIMPVKVIGSNGIGSYADIAEGIIWAADNGAHVINLSVGGIDESITLRDACAYAYNKGVTVVCASGNDGFTDQLLYPAAYDEYCIAVGATRYDEAYTAYSNRGPSLDLVAPGGDMYVDQNGDGYPDGIVQQTFSGRYNGWGYYFITGTSMSSPHVAGVAALVISHGIASTPDEVREVLETTAEDKGPAGWDPDYGHGLVDACAALNFTFQTNTPPVADANGPYTGIEDIEITFDGSASYDVEGDTLTYIWDFGDGSYSSGENPVHAYSAGGTYEVTLVVNDGEFDSEPSVTTANIEEVNDAPVADAGGDKSVFMDEIITFDGSGSVDPDGTIITYEWDFGDGNDGQGETVTHFYTVPGTYTVTLVVTDNGGLPGVDIIFVVVADLPEIEVFSDSFEVNQWNGLWSECRQDDWERSNRRASDGQYSAEINGWARNAKLRSIPINLRTKSNATITFSWYIEKTLDWRDWLKFDVSTDGGQTWTKKARLRGARRRNKKNSKGEEGVWQDVTIEVTDITSLQIRFRGKMDRRNEHANVDNVKVIAW